MSLSKIINKKTLTILGLNSGTSADGLDMAILKFYHTEKGIKIKFIVGSKKSYNNELRKSVLEFALSEKVKLDEVVYLDNVLGKFYGKQANAFLKKSAKENIKVDAVASHGQTVRHLPHRISWLKQKVHGSLQLGSADFIAAMTGKVVVSDFRQADIALGNEGAPITTGAMAALFASPVQSRLIVNIGGIANFFYFPDRKSPLPVLASDCGPGNSLCDLLSQKLFNCQFDKNGHYALKGKISSRLLSLLLAEPFFSKNKMSTGREEFGVDVVNKMIAFSERFHLSKYDLMATAGELTAFTIVSKIKTIINKDKRLSKLYLTGGGRNNIFFRNRIKYYLPVMDVAMADELGVKADYIEAAAYAVLGEACLHSKSLIHSVVNDRKKKYPVLGKITQPPLSMKKKTLL